MCIVRPTVDQLEAFEAVARLLSFRAAARAVGLSPAALSQRVRLLEEQTTQQLFVRSTRRVQLTDEGRALLPRARRVLEAVDGCINRKRGAPRPTSVTLGTRFELGLSWLVPLLPALEKTTPGLTVHLYVGASEDLLARTRQGSVDCFISSARITDTALAALHLHDETYAFVGRRDVLRDRPLRRLADATRHCLLDIDASLPLFRYLRAPDGMAPIAAFGSTRWLGTAAAIKHYVLSGSGVAVLPRYMMGRELATKRLQRILPSYAVDADAFRLIYRVGDPRASIYEALAAFLRQRSIC